jgi:Fe-S-cluster containining protein
MTGKKLSLDVIAGENAGEKQPWYVDGLRFTCTQCGNCCTGGPGVVWISREEIVRLAAHLKITPEETVERYCRKVDGRFSLKESRNHRGEYDCVFLHEEKLPRSGRGTREAGGEHDEKVEHTRRTCLAYEARPLQCRTWPFWRENLASEAVWNKSSVRCPGMNQGRQYPLERIVELRDAKDWPESAPTSKPG